MMDGHRLAAMTSIPASELMDESSYRIDAKNTARNRGGVESNRFRLQFTTKVDMEKRPPGKYTLKAFSERSTAATGRERNSSAFAM